MKIEEIRSKSDSELAYDLEHVKKELFELRIKAGTENIASPAQIRILRRTVARINTILHERANGVRGETAQ